MKMSTKKKTETKGSGKSLRELCDEALALERQKKLIEDAQKEVERELKLLAKGDKESRIATDGGGWSIQYGCTDGSFVRITKDGDTLRATLAGDADDISVVRELAGGAFTNLFGTQVVHPLVANFRDEAHRLVPASAEKLIAMVSKVGSMKVQYQVAKTPEA